MRWILFIILLSIYEEAESQSASWSAGSLDVHIVPLTLLDANPRLRLGMEYHPYSRLGYSLEVGVGSSQLNQYRFNGNLWGQDYSLLEIRPELKWYRKKHGANEVYYSAELFYLQMKDKLSNQYFYPEDTAEPVSFEEASFNKHKFGLQLKIGTKFLVWKRFSLDFYEGLGIAYRHIDYSNVVNPEIFGSTICQFWQPPHELEGKYLLAQLSLGIRVGYIIEKW